MGGASCSSKAVKLRWAELCCFFADNSRDYGCLMVLISPKSVKWNCVSTDWSSRKLKSEAADESRSVLLRFHQQVNGLTLTLRETTEAGESGTVLESEGERGTLSKNFKW